MSIDWDAVGAVAQAAAALGAGGALIYAALQLRMGQAAGASQAEEAEKTRRTEEQARQVERAIAAHRDLTTGEVGAARDRLTTLLWQEGEATYSRNVCWRPYFQELLPPRGRLGLYHADVLGNDESEPMRDLFKVLWCFERIDAARVGEALDQDMLFRLIAHHAVWWDELLQNIVETNVRSRRAVRELAGWAIARDSKLRAWAAEDLPTADEERERESQEATRDSA